MDPTRRLTDEQLEALLAGTAPAGTEGLEGLAAFAKTVPDAYRSSPRPEVASAHLARIIGELPASGPAIAGSRSPALRRARRRRTVLSTIFGTLAAKIATITVAAAAATSGLAATGNLPTPAQNAVSSVVSHVGVHISKKGAEANESTAPSGEHASKGKALGKGKFEVVGVVVTSANPTAASSPTASASTNHGRSDHSAKPNSGQDRTASAPGSLTLTVQAGSHSLDSCGIKPGDTVLVSWTTATRFSPPKVVSDSSFPANLAGKKVEAGGDITRGAGTCTFTADKMAVSAGQAAENSGQGQVNSGPHGENTEHASPNSSAAPNGNGKAGTTGNSSGHGQDTHPSPNSSEHGQR